MLGAEAVSIFNQRIIFIQIARVPPHILNCQINIFLEMAIISGRIAAQEVVKKI